MVIPIAAAVKVLATPMLRARDEAQVNALADEGPPDPPEPPVSPVPAQPVGDASQ
jgi:hypothetical protein